MKVIFCMLSVVNNALIFALTIICIDGQTDFEMPSKAAQQVSEKPQEIGNLLGMGATDNNLACRHKFFIRLSSVKFIILNKSLKF